SRLHRHSSPALEPQQRHRVVLHIEKPFRIHLALAPIHLAQTARAELGESLATHRGHLKVLEQVQAGVQQMDSEIIKASATRKLLLSEPGSNAGNARAAPPETAGVIDLSELSAFHDGLGRLRVAIETESLRDHQRSLHVLGHQEHEANVDG